MDMSGGRDSHLGGRWPAWTARALWGLAVGALLIHFIPGLGFGTGPSGPSAAFVTIAFALFVLSFATVGALVASRLPRNPIGWLLLGSAVAYILGGLTSALVDSRPGGAAGPAVPGVSRSSGWPMRRAS